MICYTTYLVTWVSIWLYNLQQTCCCLTLVIQVNKFWYGFASRESVRLWDNSLNMNLRAALGVYHFCNSMYLHWIARGLFRCQPGWYLMAYTYIGKFWAVCFVISILYLVQCSVTVLDSTNTVLHLTFRY